MLHSLFHLATAALLVLTIVVIFSWPPAFSQADLSSIIPLSSKPTVQDATPFDFESSTTSAILKPLPSLTVDENKNTTTSKAVYTEIKQTDQNIDSPYAYVFYATSDPYACSVLVNIHRLQNVLHVAHPIHVLVSSDVSSAHMTALQEADVTVHIQQVPPLADGIGGYYRDCLLKLVAFKMHILSPGLKRILAFDADQLILQNLDSLFTGLPEVDLAAPRAYWLAKDFLASTFLMISLSDRLWKTVEEALDTAGFQKFDMDLINDLLGDTVMMLSGEYVTLNSHWEDWNLPKWYHPKTAVNMTSVKLLNELAKPDFGDRRRQDDGLVEGVPVSGEIAADPLLMGLEEEIADFSLETVYSIKQPPAQRKTASARSRRPLPTKDLPSDTQLQATPEAESAPLSEPQLAPPPSLTMVPNIPPMNIPNPASPLVLPELAPPSPPIDVLPPPPPPLLPAPEPHPRFPATHLITTELYYLQDAAAVIHFTALGKPWSFTTETVHRIKPDGHPALAEQFEVWRKTAQEVCPGDWGGGGGGSGGEGVTEAGATAGGAGGEGEEAQGDGDIEKQPKVSITQNGSGGN